MHVLYIHQNYPAQFGHIGNALAAKLGWRITFLNEKFKGHHRGVNYVKYSFNTPDSPLIGRDFQSYLARSHAVYDALRHRPELKPDVIVAHSGFGNGLFLRELFDSPIIHFCEWYYNQAGSDTDFFGDKYGDNSGLLCRTRNAMLLSDLANCTLGYCPTNWQRSQIPHEFQHKLSTIFDGIDTTVWQPQERHNVKLFGKVKIPDDYQVVTYVSRGFESMRGFDIFMEFARRLCQLRKKLIFVCIGSDRVCYGGDLQRIKEASYREHVLNGRDFDLSRFVFTGTLSTSELCQALSNSDLHVYLTAPFILSWSLMNALASGCTVLASDTPPLREIITHGVNGYLASYWDVEDFVYKACTILDQPKDHRQDVASNAVEHIRRQYSLDVVLPRMVLLYEDAVNGCVPGDNSQQSCGGSRGQSLRHKANWLGRVRSLRRVGGLLPLPVAGLNRKQGIHWLKRQNRWPRKNKRISPPSPEIRLVDVERLRACLPASPRLILEIGSWTGESTRAIAELFDDSEILAVGEWFGGDADSRSHPCWKATTPHLWARFVERCWDFRERIVPIKQPYAKSVTYLSGRQIKPDVIMYWPDYNTHSIRQVISTIFECYADVELCGSSWHWPRMQAILTRSANRSQRRLTVHGNYWRLSRRTRSLD